MPDAGVAVSVTVKNFTREAQKKIEEAAKKKALAIANVIRTRILVGMSGSRTGRQYRVPGTRRFYTASAPGEYPAVRTGYLRRSIRTAVRQDLYGVYAVVGTSVVYGKWLEEKSPSDGGRPWLSRAYAEALPEIRRILGAKVQADEKL